MPENQEPDNHIPPISPTQPNDFNGHPTLRGRNGDTFRPMDLLFNESEIAALSQDELFHLDFVGRSVPKAIDLVDVPRDMNVRVLAAVRLEALTQAQFVQTPGVARPATANPIASGPSFSVMEPNSRPQAPSRLRRYRKRIAIAALAVAASVVGVVTSLPFGSSPVVALSVVLTPDPNGPSPASSGNADFLKTDNGPALHVELQGLQPNRTGEFYECWLVGDADSPEKPNRISLGTFQTKNGTVSFDWPTGAYDRKFSKVAISLEPDDGNPSFSGTSVLTTFVLPISVYP